AASEPRCVRGLPGRENVGAGSGPNVGSQTETALDIQNQPAWLFLRCPAEARGQKPRRFAALALLRRGLRRYVRGAPANRLKFAVHGTVGVVGRPAGSILKQSNRTDAPVAAEVKPVQRSARNADQITGLHLDRDHRDLLRVNMEKPPDGEESAHTTPHI